MTDNPIETRGDETSSASVFTRFMDLPPELRFKIWRYALKTPCVWAVTPGDLSPVEDHPYLIGLVNKEARQIRTETYGAPVVIRMGGYKKKCFICFDSTVIHLSSLTFGGVSFDSISAGLFRCIQHVAITWYDDVSGENTLERLGIFCLNLESVICRKPVQFADFQGVIMPASYEPITPLLASVFKSVLDYTHTTDLQMNDVAWRTHVDQHIEVFYPPSSALGLTIQGMLHLEVYDQKWIGCNAKRNRYYSDYLPQMPKIHFVGSKTALLDIRGGVQWELITEMIWTWFRVQISSPMSKF